MKIKTRLLLLLVPSIIATLLLLVLISSFNTNRQAEDLANTEARRIAFEQSALIFDKLRQAEAVVSSLVSTMNVMRADEYSDRRDMSVVIKGAASSSRNFFGIWVLWEKNAFDGNDELFVGDETFGNEQGRANAYWLWQGDSIVFNRSENFDDEPYYVQPREKGRLTIIPPYRDMDTENKILMSTIVSPIMNKGVFLGAVGIDIEMDFIHGLLKSVRPYESGYAMLISDTGVIVADPSKNEAQEKLASVTPEILEKIRSGKAFFVDGLSIFDQRPVRSFYTPVKLESFTAPWYFMVALPMDKVMAESRHSLFVQLGISAVALAVLISLVFYTTTWVARPLQRIVAHAEKVASGKLEAKLDRKGFAYELHQLSEALNVMLNSLLATMHTAEKSSSESAREAERAHKAMADAEEARRKIEAGHAALLEVAGRVDAVARKVRQTSEELTGTIGDAGRKTLEQNNLMEEAVVSISGMSDAVGHISSNAGDAAAFAERSRTRAGEGAAIVNKTLDAIDGIRTETETLGGRIKELSKGTEAIGAILGLINDIADQTNLLALNAAIEAARAGDAGRGFAVVADEVRKLAEKTMEATKEVDASIRSIRSSMEISAEGVQRTARTVQATVELGHDAQASLADIVELARGMSDQIGDIARLCREQAATGEQVLAVVERLRLLGGNVGEAMEQGGKVSRALVPEARELGLLVEQLTRNK